MSSATFKGRPVTCQDILEAMRRFDAKYPNTNDFTGSSGDWKGKGWLENRTYTYAIQHQGRFYPPKYILSKASGVPRAEFISTEANRVFRELGFEVIQKPATQ